VKVKPNRPQQQREQGDDLHIFTFPYGRLIRHEYHEPARGGQFFDRGKGVL
jgi:hypothetical protein